MIASLIELRQHLSSSRQALHKPTLDFKIFISRSLRLSLPMATPTAKMVLDNCEMSVEEICK